MLSIISSAKSMNFDPLTKHYESSEIIASDKTDKILSNLQSLSVKKIMQIMGVSEKIAKLNYERFQNYKKLPIKQVIFAYAGDVYNNIDIETLTSQTLEFAQGHLRIISGLYGILRPLDLIRAYRLEMSTKLPGIATRGLAAFWKKQITLQLNSELAEHASNFLINIASNEYSAAIDSSLLNAQLINIHFREIRNREIRNIALNSKRARGMFAGYIIRNNIDTPEKLKFFNEANYGFNKEHSDEQNYFFIR